MKRSHNAKHILEGFPIDSLRSDLLQWWDQAKRRYPWRETRDPYRILVAETLLHRTRANQVVPLYELLLHRFPDVKTLAQSSPQELTELLHSGGLHWFIGKDR